MKIKKNLNFKKDRKRNFKRKRDINIEMIYVIKKYLLGVRKCLQQKEHTSKPSILMKNHNYIIKKSIGGSFYE
ncbi:hypothetical protein UT300001_10790 [Clostridium sp. CTA-1]